MADLLGAVPSPAALFLEGDTFVGDAAAGGTFFGPTGSLTGALGDFVPDEAALGDFFPPAAGVGDFDPTGLLVPGAALGGVPPGPFLAELVGEGLLADDGAAAGCAPVGVADFPGAFGGTPDGAFAPVGVGVRPDAGDFFAALGVGEDIGSSKFLSATQRCRLWKNKQTECLFRTKKKMCGRVLMIHFIHTNSIVLKTDRFGVVFCVRTS